MDTGSDSADAPTLMRRGGHLTGMRLGVAPPTFATDGWRLPAGRLERFATKAEAEGFSGIWTTEHLLHPPGRNYSRLDPFVTMSMLAGATSTITIGTAVLILPMRDPVLFAQRAATLQYLSEERLTVGVGAGWVEAEYDAVGVPFEERGPRFTEGLALVRRLLSGDHVTFEGEFYEIEDVRIEPAVDRPPRILVGGGGVDTDDGRTVPEPVKARILEHADGWIAPPRQPSAIAEDWSEIADYLDAAGRDPSTLDRVALSWLHLVPGVSSELAEEKQRRVLVRDRNADPERTAEALGKQLTGSLEDVRARIGEYEQMGFDELVLGPTTHEPAAVDAQLDYWADLLL